MLILAGLFVAWVVGCIVLAIVWRHRRFRVVAAIQAVWLVALFASAVAMLTLGLGCFHCSGPWSYVWVFGGAFVVLLAVGILGTKLVFRFVGRS